METTNFVAPVKITSEIAFNKEIDALTTSGVRVGGGGVNLDLGVYSGVTTQDAILRKVSKPSERNPKGVAYFTRSIATKEGKIVTFNTFEPSEAKSLINPGLPVNFEVTLSTNPINDKDGEQIVKDGIPQYYKQIVMMANIPDGEESVTGKTEAKADKKAKANA